MKDLKSFLAATVLFLFLITAGSFSSLKAENSRSEVISFSPNDPSANDYTYIAVDESGIIYIYVYDGAVLIDVYPE